MYPCFVCGEVDACDACRAHNAGPHLDIDWGAIKKEMFRGYGYTYDPETPPHKDMRSRHDELDGN